jgi:phosphoenolpyruvate carboxykinase (GTP)
MKYRSVASLKSMRDNSVPLSANKHLLQWVEKIALLVKPERIHWVDGSQEENDTICAQMVERGTFLKLNQDRRLGCYYARSDPNDVARVEDRTFICSLSKENAARRTTGCTRSRCAGS